MKKLKKIIKKEKEKQEKSINLISSENYVSQEILNAQGSILTNKYAEGYPGKRYYSGCKFIDKIDKADMVIGYREQRKDHPFRHFLMTLLKFWDFVFFGFYFKDIDCGFKMFRKEALNKIMPLNSEGAMITTEILAKAKKARLKITQVNVKHYPRIYGNQSGGNLRVILRAISESFNLWKELNYGRN